MNLDNGLCCHVRAMFDNSKLKRIKLTCRCKWSWIDEIPGELFLGGAIPLPVCPNCEQHYVLYNNKLIRLEDFKTIDGREIVVDLSDAEEVPVKLKNKHVQKKAEA